MRPNEKWDTGSCLPSTIPCCYREIKLCSSQGDQEKKAGGSSCSSDPSPFFCWHCPVEDHSPWVGFPLLLAQHSAPQTESSVPTLLHLWVSCKSPVPLNLPATLCPHRFNLSASQSRSLYPPGFLPVAWPVIQTRRIRRPPLPAALGAWGQQWWWPCDCQPGTGLLRVWELEEQRTGCQTAGFQLGISGGSIAWAATSHVRMGVMVVGVGMSWGPRSKHCSVCNFALLWKVA